MNSSGPVSLPFGSHSLVALRAPKSRHDHVLRKLGLGIAGGAYPEGSLLPGDAELLGQLSVSRTVLREALKTLSAKGMVQAKAKTGTRVMERRYWNLFDSDVLHWHLESGPDTRFLSNLSEMRLIFEPEAAALAASRRSAEQLARLYHWVEAMASSRSSTTEFVEGDLGFHLTVAEASGNPFMRSINSVIEVALAMTFSISSPLPNLDVHAHSVARHRAIAEAIERGDADSARAAMRTVITDGLERAAQIVGASVYRTV